MAPFLEVMLRVRFGWQKFIKNIVCTVPNFRKQSFISIANYSSSAVVADSHRPHRAARRRNASMRWRSADVEKPHHAGAA